MKKFFQLIGGLVVLGAAVAGGIALYQKYFTPEDIPDEFEDDPEDEFEEDLDASDRCYTPLNHLVEDTKSY